MRGTFHLHGEALKLVRRSAQILLLSADVPILYVYDGVAELRRRSSINKLSLLDY
jgi:hypothetical protein